MFSLFTQDIYCQKELQLRPLILTFHFFLHLLLRELSRTPFFLLLEFRVQSNTKHWTILTPPSWTVRASTSHITRDDLLLIYRMRNVGCYTYAIKKSINYVYTRMANGTPDVYLQAGLVHIIGKGNCYHHHLKSHQKL